MDLIEKLKNVPRYDVVICNCVIGPHTEFVLSDTGDFMKWEDVEEILKEHVKE
jgi:hypothetical protein